MSHKAQPSENALERIRAYVEKYWEKTGTSPHPNPDVTEAVMLGLAQNVDEVGRPLCPCNFYPDKQAELAAGRRWVCACDEMKQYKYCHCLLFVTPEGLPITEYLPEGHEGREIYGLVQDPSRDKGRESRHKLEKGAGKRGREPFVGTARRVLRTKGSRPLFPTNERVTNHECDCLR